jgi:uncharacterized protein HemX
MNWYESPPDSQYDGPDPGFPEPPTMQQMPPVRATIYHRRKPAEWGQIAPYLAALVGVAVVVTAVALALGWKGTMQEQVNELRHQLAVTQAQMAAAANSGQTQLSGLAQRVAGLHGQVSALSGQVFAFGSQCTADMTGPAGVAAYVVPCRR